MRKALLPFLFLFIALPAFPSFFESNAVGMELSALDEFKESGYCLEAGDGQRRLYLDGEELWSETSSKNERTHKEGNREEKWSYDNEGRIQSYSVKDKSGERTRRYEYSENGILKRTIENDGEGIEKISTYVYDESKGLVSIASTDVSYMLDGAYVYSESNEASRIEVLPGTLLSMGIGDDISYERRDDGGYDVKETEDGTTTLSSYDGKGNLLKKDKMDQYGNVMSSLSYAYDEQGNVVSEEEVEGEARRVCLFVDGRKSEETFFEGDAISKRRAYGESRMFTETLYRDGKEYARVRYDSDGKRVLSLEMLQ